jgi:lysophospholipase L1-like esterase
VIAAYDRALREVARGEGAFLVDFEAMGFELRLIGADGLHPTEEGYQRMAEILFDQARTWFELGE